MKSKPIYKTLLLEGIHPKAQLTLKNAGLEVTTLAQSISNDELLKRAQGLSILGSRSRTMIASDILSIDSLLCVGAFCIGTNQINLEEANKKGVAIFNGPYSNTRSVAEMVIGLIIFLSRNLFNYSWDVHQGVWNKSAKTCFEIRDKTLGVIGYGNIGSQVGILAEALGMRVIYYDTAIKLPLGNAKPNHDMTSLLKEADFVTLHVPETPESKNLMNKTAIQQMKKSAFLINTSRGSVVDLDALKEALDSKHLAGAAVDVYPKEPKSNQETFHSVLQNTKRVILTPHIGGSTEEAQESIGLEVSKSIKDFVLLGSTTTSVNFPQLQLPAIQENTTRISNVHKNQPGVLGNINNLVSQSKANIKSQYLSTKEDIGYLVMDIEKKDIQSLYQQMSQLDTSIKTRMISS